MKEDKVMLNVDELFEQQSVPNIEKEHRRILNVIEEKREELRSLVGERYRDLIEAADTIASMKECSKGILKQLSDINENCLKLNECQLIGFKSVTEDSSTHPDKQNRLRFFSTMLQIKLLTSLAEIIWSYIDKKNFSIAAALYIYSRHISTGLRLDSQNPFKDKLPVAVKQWNILKSYYSTIKHYVICELQSEALKKDDVPDYLLSLLLLDNSNLTTVLGQFLTLRSSSYYKCLDDGEIRQQLTLGLKPKTVKERILNSLRVLNETMELLSSCFLENQRLLKKYNELCNCSSKPLFRFIEDGVVNFVHHLPEVVTKFQIQNKSMEFDKNQAGEELNKWLNYIELVESHLQGLIKQLPTMQVVKDVQIEAWQYQKQYKFGEVVESLQPKFPLDFYAWKYSPLLTKRFCEIIENEFSNKTKEFLNGIKAHFAELDNLGNMNMWEDNVKELPVSLQEALEKQVYDKKMLMKTKGYNKALTDICMNFDKNLTNVINEIDLLMEKECISNEEKVEIIEFLITTTLSFIKDMVKSVRKWETDTNKTKELTFLALCWVAIVELCPSLKICLNAQTKWRRCINKKLEITKELWPVLCEDMRRESLHYWNILIKSILKNFAIEDCMPKPETEADILQDWVAWEVIASEASAEETGTVVTSFRIPSQPSISLQHYLFKLTNKVKSCVPQTLPSNVLQILNSKLLVKLIEYYQGRLKTISLLNEESKSTGVNENVALQMYFDLSYLNDFFTCTLQEQPALKTDINNLQEKFKALIDPIDFELFLENLLVNCKRSASRLNSKFGILTTLHATTSFTSKEKNANILALSGCSPTLWFSLMPIVSIGGKTQLQMPSRAESEISNKTASMHKTSQSSPFFW